MPSRPLSFMMMRSSPPSFTSVLDHLPNRTRSPALDVERNDTAILGARDAARRDDLALPRFFLRVVGNKNSAGAFSCALTRRKRTWSCRERNDMDKIPSLGRDEPSLSQAASQRCRFAIRHGPTDKRVGSGRAEYKGRGQLTGCRRRKGRRPISPDRQRSSGVSTSPGLRRSDVVVQPITQPRRRPRFRHR